MKRLLVLGVLVAASAVPISSERSEAERPNPSGQARELGTVRWSRDLDASLARARGEGLPIFALFQEVPGCATCVGFGETVLSSPLLVEAIESEFVPLAIFNNEGGRDAEALRRFGEPSWSNPVVRFLDAEGEDLLPRRDAIYTQAVIAERMIAALTSAKRPVPGYLRLAAREARLETASRASFVTHCYWEGEACLGAHEGVVGTRTGWLGGREVVEVRYDASVLSYEELLRASLAGGCSEEVYAHDERQRETARRVLGREIGRAPSATRWAGESDQKFHLRRSRFARLPLTPLQATRINAALGAGADPTPWLSPRQKAALARDGS